jgi:hypothetical protein
MESKAEIKPYHETKPGSRKYQMFMARTPAAITNPSTHPEEVVDKAAVVFMAPQSDHIRFVTRRILINPPEGGWISAFDRICGDKFDVPRKSQKKMHWVGPTIAIG